ncbi:hypothetical protein IWX64_001968 [Arthrobacter sp. CAN_A212]|uniref:hypothetical protein n=1 Tax=Arthrobacter sp. CAN_A212 TaxID=2787719 RepID=UPI0018CBC6AA
MPTTCIKTDPCRTNPTPGTGSRIRSLRALKRGDRIEARMQADVLYRGLVEETAPGLGTVWMRDETADSRLALSQDDFTFWTT